MQTASKRIIRAWAMYDWANSTYNLVITTTFFPIYFTSATKAVFGSEEIPLLGRSYLNSSLYNYTLAATYFIIALFYPVLAAIADTRGNKKFFIKFFCLMGALGCSGLYWFTGENVGFGVLCFMLASAGYVGSLVFYNAFLPEIAAPADRDRISAKGFAFGYVGSVLMQIIGFILVLMITSNPFLAPRITFLLVGLWWIGFAQITFRYVPEQSHNNTELKDNVIKQGFYEIKKVYAQVKTLPVMKNFLRGFFFYSMGVQTVMLAATIFASKVLQLEDTKLIVTVVIIQLVAIPGAIIMSRLSQKYGNLRVLLGVVVIWILICLAAYQATVYKEGGGDPEFYFYGLSAIVGLVMGGIQSLSRSTFAKLMPSNINETASFFTYYDFSEKIAIVLGMFAFGYLEELTGSMKLSILSLIVFFLLGIIWLLKALKKQSVVDSV
jgi:UMF1 family MFS transporter